MDKVLRRRRVRKILNRNIEFSARDILTNRNFGYGAFRNQVTERSHDDSLYEIVPFMTAEGWSSNEDPFGYYLDYDEGFDILELGESVEDFMLGLTFNSFLMTSVSLSEKVDDFTFYKLIRLKGLLNGTVVESKG